MVALNVEMEEMNGRDVLMRCVNSCMFNGDSGDIAGAVLREFSTAGLSVENAAEVESLRTENARLRDVLVDARLQLEYLDSRWPTGTTPTILARINTVMESK